MTVGDLIKNKDYDYIEWRITLPDHPNTDYPEGIFSGYCHSINGELIPHDYDYYSPNEEVLNYEEFEDPDKQIYSGLTVLVEGEWISL